MTSAASVVAYYGEKPGDLQNLIGETQECVGGAPGGHFCPGDRHEVHATIIGLETPSQVLAWVTCFSIL